MMRVLHLASANRWTGAAAPAFAEVLSLREHDVDAHYAYVGGYRLEEKIGKEPFAHPIIEKAQNPVAFYRSVRALIDLTRRHRFDILHAHLTHDHWLAHAVARAADVRLARTFHSRRVLRRDPFTRKLVHDASHLLVVNDTFRHAPLFNGRNVVFTPPPLDLAQFTAGGERVRARYGLDAAVPVVAAIGKVAPARGWEAVLESFASLRKLREDARLLIIGHGPHRPHLEKIAGELQITPFVIWAGYHEDDLAEHYRAADLLFFTAAGSDEGHRALLEAMACGVVPVTYPIAGAEALLGPMARELTAPRAEAQALARVADSALKELERLRRSVIEHAQRFGYKEAGARLLAAYSDVSRP